MEIYIPKTGCFKLSDGEKGLKNGWHILKLWTVLKTEERSSFPISGFVFTTKFGDVQAVAIYLRSGLPPGWCWSNMEVVNVRFNYLKTQWQNGLSLSKYLPIPVRFAHLGDESWDLEQFIAYYQFRLAMRTSLSYLIILRVIENAGTVTYTTTKWDVIYVDYKTFISYHFNTWRLDLHTDNNMLWWWLVTEEWFHMPQTCHLQNPEIRFRKWQIHDI